MRKGFILLITLIFLANVATASTFEDILQFIGLGTETITTDLREVTTYGYQQADETIVRTSHSMDMGTIVSEKYYWADPEKDPIISTSECSWGWFLSTCELHLEYGNQSINKTNTDIQLIPLRKEIVTSIVSDLNGTAGIGIAIKRISTGYLDSTLYISELKTIPLTTLTGDATDPVDVKVETMTYADYAGYQSQVEQVVEGGVIERFWNIWFTLSEILNTLFYYFKLIFYDNPILALGLIEVLILGKALAAKDVMGWWERFIKAHVNLYNFLMAVIDKIIGILAAIINALKPF